MMNRPIALHREKTTTTNTMTVRDNSYFSQCCWIVVLCLLSWSIGFGFLVLCVSLVPMDGTTRISSSESNNHNVAFLKNSTNHAEELYRNDEHRSNATTIQQHFWTKDDHRRRLIINGKDASPGEYPYFSLLPNPGCGGTLIAPDIILTAGHCRMRDVSSYGKVLVGHYADFGGRHSDAIAVSKQRLHPDFNDEVCCGYAGRNGPSFYGVYNDFLLLKLESSSSQQTIRLNQVDSKPGSNRDLHVIGVGDTDPDPYSYRSPPILQEVTVNYMSNEKCADSSIYPSNLLDDSSFCAMDHNEDACGGDSGGPLIQRTSNNRDDLQVGLVSWGYGCADQPGVYGRISHVYDWIRDGVCDLSTSPPARFQCPQAPTRATPAPVAPPTKAPTKAPAPTTVPSKAPVMAPTASPSNSPVVAPTTNPSKSPVVAPTKTPTAAPSKSPVVAPSKAPSVAPSIVPTKGPTKGPTSNPTRAPTKAPTTAPTKKPTKSPTTDAPTNAPPTTTGAPTAATSRNIDPDPSPISIETEAPVEASTKAPIKRPTVAPTASPSDTPSAIPSDTPSTMPSDSPSATPSDTSSSTPSDTSSAVPSDSTSSTPSDSVSSAPSDTPSSIPSYTPSSSPSDPPSSTPSDAPSATPSDIPSSIPSDQPVEETRLEVTVQHEVEKLSPGGSPDIEVPTESGTVSTDDDSSTITNKNIVSNSSPILHRSVLPTGVHCDVASASSAVCCSSLSNGNQNEGSSLHQECVPSKTGRTFRNGFGGCEALPWILDNDPSNFDTKRCPTIVAIREQLAVHQSCASVVDREECCRFFDNRADGSSYDGQPCVPSRNESGFPGEGFGTCEPANRVAKHFPEEAMECSRDTGETPSVQNIADSEQHQQLDGNTTNSSSKKPIIYTMVVIAMFLLMAVVFFVYDFLVERRQTPKMVSTGGESPITHISLPPKSHPFTCIADPHVSCRARDGSLANSNNDPIVMSLDGNSSEKSSNCAVQPCIPARFLGETNFSSGATCVPEEWVHISRPLVTVVTAASRENVTMKARADDDSNIC